MRARIVIAEHATDIVVGRHTHAKQLQPVVVAEVALFSGEAYRAVAVEEVGVIATQAVAAAEFKLSAVAQIDHVGRFEPEVKIPVGTLAAAVVETGMHDGIFPSSLLLQPAALPIGVQLQQRLRLAIQRIGVFTAQNPLLLAAGRKPCTCHQAPTDIQIFGTADLTDVESPLVRILQ